MKLHDAGGTFILMLLSVALIAYGTSLILGDDQPIEEAAEVYIEQQTGINIDLTPGSPE